MTFGKMGHMENLEKTRHPGNGAGKTWTFEKFWGTRKFRKKTLVEKIWTVERFRDTQTSGRKRKRSFNKTGHPNKSAAHSELWPDILSHINSDVGVLCDIRSHITATFVFM